MLDAKRLLDQFLGSQTGAASPGGLDAGQLGELARKHLGGFGGGALAGGLAGLLLGTKSGRKLGGSALKLGGMALVGALAYKAYQNWQAGRQPAATTGEPLLAPPADSPFNPGDEGEQQLLGRQLMRAMIAAAKADGHIDSAEQGKIFAAMDRLDLDAEDKAFIMDELRAPLDIDAVAGAARTPEEAAELYTASLLALDVDTAAERGYLALLAARLGLDDALVTHLDAAGRSAKDDTPTAP